MLKPLRSMLEVFISSSRLRLICAYGFTSRRKPAVVTSTWDPEHFSVDSLSVKLDKALSQIDFPGVRAKIVLADDMVRYFMVTPPSNTARLEDCKAAAQMRFQTLHGESAANWQLEADWNCFDPFLVCAVSKALLEAVQHVTSRYRVSVVCLVPNYIFSWNQSCKKHPARAWFGTVSDGVLTIGVRDNRTLRAVLTTHFLHIPDAQWLETHLLREALRLSVSPPEEIQLCGAIPESWTGTFPSGMTCINVKPKGMHDIESSLVDSDVLLADKTE